MTDQMIANWLIDAYVLLNENSFESGLDWDRIQHSDLQEALSLIMCSIQILQDRQRKMSIEDMQRMKGSILNENHN